MRMTQLPNSNKGIVELFMETNMLKSVSRSDRLDLLEIAPRVQMSETLIISVIAVLLLIYMQIYLKMSFFVPEIDGGSLLLHGESRRNVILQVVQTYVQFWFSLFLCKLLSTNRGFFESKRLPICFMIAAINKYEINLQYIIIIIKSQFLTVSGLKLIISIVANVRIGIMSTNKSLAKLSKQYAQLNNLISIFIYQKY
uniref:Transmembrane domain-containing protein n=1 Tax=Spironucleus salmonicida TaxID=348837 RepID=V6LW26_9EUKA|eukprot:EST48832.1 Transmembrane domain-containing protein [Spironucleus salmonicida]